MNFIIDDIKILKNYLKIVKFKKGNTISIIITAFIYNFIALIIPIVSAKIIDILAFGDIKKAYLYLIWFVITSVIYHIFHYLNRIIYLLSINSHHDYLQNKLMDKVDNLNNDYFKDLSREKIINLLSDDSINVSDIKYYFIEVTMSVIKILLILGILLYINLLFGIMCIFIDVLYLFLLNFSNKQSSFHLEGERKYNDLMSGVVGDMLDGIKEVKTYNLMSKLTNKYNILKKKWIIEYRKRSINDINALVSVPLIINIFKGIMYLLMIFLFTNKIITFAQIIIIIAYFEMMKSESDECMSYSKILNEKNVGVRRITKFLNYDKKNITFGNNVNDYLFGLIEFKNVYLKSNNKVILDHISFSALPNSVTLITGPVGSGKTSIINLLLRQLKPNKGKILIDNIDIYSYTKEIFASNLTAISSKPYFFNMSIRENLDLINTDKLMQEEVCKRIGVYDKIMSLSKGFNTIINDNTNEIDDTMRLLLAIGRIILSNAEIILFDEITNNIDRNGLKIITEIINELKYDHTIIIASHKKELFKLADNLILINEGKVVTSGSYNTIVKNKKYNQCL